MGARTNESPLIRGHGGREVSSEAYIPIWERCRLLAYRHLPTTRRFLESNLVAGNTVTASIVRHNTSAVMPNQSFNRKFCPGSGLGIISFLPKPEPGQNSG